MYWPAEPLGWVWVRARTNPLPGTTWVQACTTVIPIREVEEYQLGAEVAVLEPDEKDIKLVTKYVTEWCGHFGHDVDEIMSEPFIKLKAISSRPYGNLYAY